jgi:hypothetical protein
MTGLKVCAQRLPNHQLRLRCRADAPAHLRMTIPIQVRRRAAGVVIKATPNQTPSPLKRLPAKAMRRDEGATTQGAITTPNNMKAKAKAYAALTRQRARRQPAILGYCSGSLGRSNQ